MTRFPYLFTKRPDSPSYFVPPMVMHQVDAGTRISVGGCEIDILHQDHGNSTSLGFIFDGKFAYSTDVINMSDAVFEQLSGIDLWIVEALRADPHSAHSHYEQTFAWIERVKPGRAVLTHLGLSADYQELLAICPDRTEPGVDGMQFRL